MARGERDGRATRRLWNLATVLDATRGPARPPWTCQLISAESTEESLVLDFVALEACPIGGLGCPSHAPFTIHVERVAGPPDRSQDAALVAWARSADVVTIACESGRGAAWLRIVSAHHQLILRQAAGDEADRAER